MGRSWQGLCVSAAPSIGPIGTTLTGAGATIHEIMVESCDALFAFDVVLWSGVGKGNHALLFLTVFSSSSLHALIPLSCFSCFFDFF